MILPTFSHFTSMFGGVRGHWNYLSLISTYTEIVLRRGIIVSQVLYLVDGNKCYHSWMVNTLSFPDLRPSSYKYKKDFSPHWGIDRVRVLTSHCPHLIIKYINILFYCLNTLQLSTEGKLIFQLKYRA